MDIVRTQSLLKCHNGYSAFTLGHVNLQVGPGEILGILGPDGAGKTTLLRMLWGFVRPTAGTIEVLGLAPHLHQIEVRRYAGYVTRNSAFYDWMTAADFLKFVSSFYPTWDRGRVDELFNEFGLSGSTRIDQFSAEEKLKLRLTAALGHRPRVLFLDDLMGAEFAASWWEIHAFLKQLAKNEGVAIVISSFMGDRLDRLADKVLMLHRGRVLQCGSVAALRKEFGLTSLEEIFSGSLEKVQRNIYRANA